MLYLFIYFKHLIALTWAQHSSSAAHHLSSLMLACGPLAVSIFAGSLTCVCVCEWQRRVSDERGELKVMLSWIQMRESNLNPDQAASSLSLYLSLFLSPTFSLHPSEWKYFREIHLSEPVWLSLGHRFKVVVQVFFRKECLFSFFYCFFGVFFKRLNSQTAGFWRDWCEAAFRREADDEQSLASCSKTLEAECVSIFSSPHSLPVNFFQNTQRS